MMIPQLSITFAAVAGLFSVALPTGIFIAWRKKYDLKIIPLFIGATAFVVFAMLLEQIPHYFLVRPGTDAADWLDKNPAIKVLYIIFAAGVFEETARFLSFKFLNRRFKDFGTALSYGIGHGGIEAILLLGFASLNNVALMQMINTGAPEMLAEYGITPEVIAPLADARPYMFLVGALERLFAVVIHISLSVLVWFSVTRKDVVWLYPAAIFLHAAVNLPAALMQTGLLQSLFVTEALIGAGALVLAVLAIYAYRKLSVSDTGAPDSIASLS